MPLYKLSDSSGDLGKKPTKMQRINKTPKDIPQEDKPLAEEAKRKRRKLSDMTEDEQVDAAKDTILNILSMVAKSRKQLFQRLLEKGYPENVAELALKRMEEVGVINDKNFAAQWAASRHSGSGLAPYSIKRELMLKGIDEQIIEEILEPFNDSDLELRAYELAKSKARTVSGDRNAKIRKIASAVARKGYSSNIAFKVAKQVLEEAGENTEDIVEESL